MAPRQPSTPAGRSRNRARGAGAASGRRAAHPAKPKAATTTRKPTAKSKPKPKPRKPAAPKRARNASSGASSGQTRNWSVVAAHAIAIVALVAAGYFLWLRDSGLVAIKDVEVAGIQGPEREAVTAALGEAAASMTTLHVKTGELEKAVAGFETVAGIEADATFPHGLQIRVIGRPPVIAIRAGGASPVPVAADGTILETIDISRERLPVAGAAEAPTGASVSGDALAAAQVAGAIPLPLLPLTKKVSTSDLDNIEVQLRGGIPVRFGDASRAEEKWAAVAAILADPRVDNVTAIDVRVPERPALAGAAPPPELAPPDEVILAPDPVAEPPAAVAPSEDLPAP